MKPKRSHARKPARITNSRWLAYATAGAASSFACGNSAEAAIHYSGIIGEFSGSFQRRSASFQLDQPGDSFRLRHALFFSGTLSYGGYAHFGIFGRAGASFAGFYCPSNPQAASVSKLNRGQLISTRPFLARNFGLLAAGFANCVGQFDSGDVGFIGFRFNKGTGNQYGWVRIRMATRNPIDHDFWLIDYAYADPGEAIRAGQMSSNEMVPEENDEVVPEEGSLGALALGAAGLLAWRERRSQATR